mgnify:CR=1 FL=1
MYSTAALFAMTAAGEAAGHYLHELYYESAATILTLITLGKLLVPAETALPGPLSTGMLSPVRDASSTALSCF